MIGTLLNICTVLLGGTVGTLVGDRLPVKVRQTVLNAVGLMTLLIGFQMALTTKSAIIVLVSMALGAVIGELVRIDDGLNAFGDWVQTRVTSRSGGANRASGAEDNGDKGSLISKGFVTASLVFCVGPMSILGAFQNGLTGAYDTLAVKSVLDGITAVALASSLGWGVVLSSLVVLIYQGALTLSAVWAKPFLSDPVVLEMTAAGGLMIVGIGLNILEIARIRVANLLPALIIAPMLVAVMGGS